MTNALVAVHLHIDIYMHNQDCMSAFTGVAYMLCCFPVICAVDFAVPENEYR